MVIIEFGRLRRHVCLQKIGSADALVCLRSECLGSMTVAHTPRINVLYVLALHCHKADQS